jgi:bifunctional lysine-specific demethylase and histidyl-hydroxylase NO66
MEFAEFIAPIDAAEFRSQVFGKRPLHVTKSGDGSGSLLPWRRFNEVLALTPYWNEDSLKVYFRSRAALRDNYCDTADLRPGQPAPVSPAKVKALMGLGASLIANHLHRVCPEVGAVAAMLEREFAARAFANVYCSFKGVQAFQTHYDLHDVFAVQAEGVKTWRVYESRADAPVNPVPPGDEWEKWLTQTRGKLLFEAEMKPGDVLYLPRGQYHDALTGDAASLHVTFGVSPATGLSVFKLLESALAKESEFRQYLPDARSGAALGERLALLADRVRAVMASPAFATDVLNHQRGLARAPADYELPAQRPPAWYSVARKAQVVRRDTGFAIAFDGGELPVGATYPTIEWILKQRMFSVDDALARQPGSERADLLRDLERLEKAGLIVATEMR